jgi:23S rRNA (cytosine1962-C5)-methyltransferase
MTRRAVLRLKKDEDRRIRAGHVWVFSNEIDVHATPLASLPPGEEVEVQDSRGGFVGAGYANPNSLISIRLLTRQAKQSIDEELLRARLRNALALRERLFASDPYYRLVFGESDGLPGLVVDRFGEILVVQPNTAGIERLLGTLVDLLVEATGATGVLVRADSPSRKNEGLDLHVRTVRGIVPDWVPVRENGVRFRAPILEGQKTGWFYDHRMNRDRLRRYVPEARVLDVFAYVGGWGVQAAAFGAREVVCVDSSAPALAGAVANADINGVTDRLAIRQGDAFEVLQEIRSSGDRYDVVILDPPAFIKRKKDIKEGEQAYRRLNRLALEMLPRGGILVSASCSFHLERDALLRTILWAANHSNREIQIVEEGHQGPDHPVHPAIPETSYLKTFFVRVLS